MTRGKTLAGIVLSPDEIERLERLATAGNRRSESAIRAQIVLKSLCGEGPREIAAELGVTPQTVSKWCERFASTRWEIFTAGRRNPRGPTVETTEIDRVLEILRTSPPGGRDTWSTHRLASATGLPQTAISRLLRGLALRPDGAFVRRHCRGVEILDAMDSLIGVLIGDRNVGFVLGMTKNSRGRPVAGHPPTDPRASNLADAITQVYRLRSSSSSSTAALEPGLIEFLSELSGPEEPSRWVAIVATTPELQSTKFRHFQESRKNLSVFGVPPGVGWLDLCSRWINHFSLRGINVPELSQALFGGPILLPPERRALAWIESTARAQVGAAAQA